MDPRRHLKFITLVSIVSLVLVLGFLPVGISWAIYTAALADIIQIVTYLAWLWQKEVPLEHVPKQVEAIYQYVQQKEESHQAREEIISRLINEGVIPEDELYSLIRDKEVILAFPYGKGVPDGVRNLGYEQSPHIALLRRIGFVRVTRLQNLMVAFADGLPRSLREIDSLNAFIRSELPKMWKQISAKTAAAFPPAQYQKYEKWRTGEGFGLTYILSKSMARDFIIDYINRESFTPEFKRHIWGAIDRNELKDAIARRRQQVKTVISRSSISILLRDFPKSAREEIMDHESQIKGMLRIEVFTDYRLLGRPTLNEVISGFLPEAEKGNVDRYSSTIISESKKYYDLLSELGIAM